jgi:hypothetical protein
MVIVPGISWVDGREPLVVVGAGKGVERIDLFSEALKPLLLCP